MLMHVELPSKEPFVHIIVDINPQWTHYNNASTRKWYQSLFSREGNVVWTWSTAYRSVIECWFFWKNFMQNLAKNVQYVSHANLIQTISCVVNVLKKYSFCWTLDTPSVHHTQVKSIGCHFKHNNRLDSCQRDPLQASTAGSSVTTFKKTWPIIRWPVLWIPSMFTVSGEIWFHVDRFEKILAIAPKQTSDQIQVIFVSSEMHDCNFLQVRGGSDETIYRYYGTPQCVTARDIFNWQVYRNSVALKTQCDQASADK